MVVPGPAYLLSGGLHSFYLHGHFDYSHLDQIIVLPEERKPGDMGLAGDGPFPTSAAAPHDFSVMRTSPIQPACVKAWKKIGVDADLHGGQLKIKISTDGLAWLPVEELAKLPAHGDGSDVLHIRIALRRAPGNPSPKLKRAWVDYDAGGVPELAVKNSALEVRFSPEGHMMGIRDVKNDRWFLPHAIHQRLFELKTRSPGENSLRAYQQGEGPTLIDRRYEKTGDRQRLAFTYGLLDSAIRATCTFTLDSTSLATWSMQIANESPVEVREYTFPQFRGLRLGRSELDDLAAWPTTVGGLYPSPGAGGLDWLTTMRYPGDCGMPWADFSDASGGFYLCSQDPTLTATDITYEPAPTAEAGTSASPSKATCRRESPHSFNTRLAFIRATGIGPPIRIIAGFIRGTSRQNIPSGP